MQCVGSQDGPSPRTNTISQQDLPAMSTSFRELWSLLQTEHFWGALLHTVRGWALGLGIAAKAFPAVVIPPAFAYVWRTRGRREAHKIADNIPTAKKCLSAISLDVLWRCAWAPD